MQNKCTSFFGKKESRDNCLSDLGSLSNFRSIICQAVAYGSLKTKENFQLSAIKVIVVANERWSLPRCSKYSDLTYKLWYFGKLVADERWSLTKGGRIRRLDCIPIIADVVFGVDKLTADSIRQSLYYPMGPIDKLKN